MQRLNGGRKSCMLKKKCLFLIMIFSICICISSCDASYLENAEKKMLEWLETNVDYEYTILIRYENYKDKPSFEKRIKSLGLNIVNSVQKDDCITYDLNSHYPIEDQTLYLLCTTQSVLVVDKDGNEILKETDVISVALDITSSANIVVANDYCQMFDKKYIADIIRLIIDDKTYDVDAIARENDNQSMIIFVSNDEEIKMGIKQMVIAFASEPLVGEVEMTIEKSATRV